MNIHLEKKNESTKYEAVKRILKINQISFGITVSNMMSATGVLFLTLNSARQNNENPIVFFFLIKRKEIKSEMLAPVSQSR